MPTNTNVTNLKINELTEAQYDAAVQGGTIGANELSVITDLDEAIQVSSLPTAAAGEVGKIYQFIGTTDANYTHGYFYECVSDGGNPATYSWSQLNVQPAGSSLPSQTGQSGKFLTTDGTDASWATVSAGQVIQVATLPTASADELGNIYQFIGTTDANYTNGYFYKCVSDGAATPTYSWTNIQVQASSGGLPSQTGNAGKFLATNGTTASWSNNVIVSSASEGGISISSTNTNISIRRITIGNGTAAAGRYGVAIGYNAQTGESGVAIGNAAKANGSCSFAAGEGATTTTYGIAIGTENKTTANYAIQIGGTYKTNSDANTFKVGNQNGNFELMSADGTIPTARLTKVNSTITLTSAGWSSNTQTVSVTGMTATAVVLVAPDSTSQSDYTSAGILCTAQGAGTLTFTCSTTPTNAITVNVVAL